MDGGLGHLGLMAREVAARFSSSVNRIRDGRDLEGNGDERRERKQNRR